MADSVNDIRAKTSTTYEPVPGIVVAQSTSSSSSPSPATSLPLAPTAAQQALLVDSTSAPTYAWLLQFSGAAAKWLFLGGSPATSYVDANESTTSTSYVDLTTVQSITVPRAGSYLVEYGCDIEASASTVACDIAVTKSGVVQSTTQQTTANTTGGFVSAYRAQVVSGLAAADVLKLQFKVNGAVTGHFQYRSLQIRPVFVT